MPSFPLPYLNFRVAVISDINFFVALFCTLSFRVAEFSVTVFPSVIAPAVVPRLLSGRYHRAGQNGRSWESWGDL